MNHLLAPRYPELITQLDAAFALTERLDTEYPDNSYEEGVLDTLRWLLGEGAAPLDLALLADPAPADATPCADLRSL